MKRSRLQKNEDSVETYKPEKGQSNQDKCSPKNRDVKLIDRRLLQMDGLKRALWGGET